MHDARDHILSLIRNDPWRMAVLAAVRNLARPERALPDWAIGAGFVRAAVWDAHCGFDKPTPLADIDVVYFDSRHLSPVYELRHQRTLAARNPQIPWSVKNQARMHRRNRDLPYSDTADAIGHWLETPTCVAVRLSADDHLELIAPHGIDDLIQCRSRPTAAARHKMTAYDERIKAKNWRHIWPDLTVHKV